MNKKKAVVSLGHEALGYTILEQRDAVKKTARALADLVEADYQLTITHSNGRFSAYREEQIKTCSTALFC